MQGGGSAQNTTNRLWSQFQSCTSAQISPTPDINPNPKLNAVGGAQGRQGQPRRSAACFGGVFPKTRAAEKPDSTDKTNDRYDFLCRPALHIYIRRNNEGGPWIIASYMVEAGFELRRPF